MTKCEQPSNNGALNAILADYKLYLKLERGLSGNTLEAYLYDLDKLLSYLLPCGVDPLQATPADMHAFLRDLYDLGIHPTSQARILSGVRSFYRFLVMEEHLAADPTELIQRPRLPRVLPYVPTIEDIDAMVLHADVGTTEGQRNRAIIETLYGCGLRVSELINLKLFECFFDDGFIKVEGKGSKQRLVPIARRTVEEIYNYLEYRQQVDIKPGYEDFLFISSHRRKSLSRIMIFRIVKDLAEAAGISHNLSPHSLRHAFATHLLEGGANIRLIQMMLGHESIQTTEIYTEINPQRLRSEIISCHPRNIRYGGGRR